MTQSSGSPGFWARCASTSERFMRAGSRMRATMVPFERSRRAKRPLSFPGDGRMTVLCTSSDRSEAMFECGDDFCGGVAGCKGSLRAGLV